MNNTKMSKNQSMKLKPKTLRDENISILDKKDKFAVITEEGKIENFITIRKEVSNNDTPLFKLSLWNQVKIALVDYDKKKGYSKKRAEKRKQKEEQKRAVDAQKLKKFLLEQGKNLGNDDVGQQGHGPAAVLDVLAKGPEGQLGKLKALEPPGDADDGDAPKDTGKKPAQSQKEPAEQEPENVADQAHGSDSLLI